MALKPRAFSTIGIGLTVISSEAIPHPRKGEFHGFIPVDHVSSCSFWKSDLVVSRPIASNPSSI